MEEAQDEDFPLHIPALELMVPDDRGPSEKLIWMLAFAAIEFTTRGVRDAQSKEQILGGKLQRILCKNLGTRLKKKLGS